MIEPTDEMIRDAERAYGGNVEGDMAGAVKAVLALVERDRAGPCSAILDGITGSGQIWCMLRHGHAGDHLADNGLTRWKERTQ